MSKNATLIVCALVGIAAAGCSESADTGLDRDAAMPRADAGDPGPIPPPPPPPDPIDCATDTVASFFGTVTTLADRTPIQGARVCVFDHPELPCVTTDAAGFYVLECAPIGDAAIAFDADGFAGAMWLWEGSSDERRELSLFLATDAAQAAYLAPAGVTYPDGESGLVTIVFMGPVQGLTAVQRSGTGTGAIYTMYEGGSVAPMAPSLSGPSEQALFVARPWDGWNEIEIELVPPAGVTCMQLDGTWGSRDGAPNAVRTPVRPGSNTLIWMRCQ